MALLAVAEARYPDGHAVSHAQRDRRERVFLKEPASQVRASSQKRKPQGVNPGASHNQKKTSTLVRDSLQPFV